jgi:hypothetical protein
MPCNLQIAANYQIQLAQARRAEALKWAKWYKLAEWCRLNGIYADNIHDSIYIDRSTVWCCLSKKLDDKLEEIFGKIREVQVYTPDKGWTQK